MDAPVSVGEVLAGKYRVERVLGAGGMGVVVAARHLQLDEHVALKFLLPGAASSGEVVARFAREARAAAKIKSEHVARVMDVGTLDGGAPYMVMEYLSGVDLAGVLKQRGALSVQDAAEYVLQACEAIGEAHSLGIVHRDLKPANLFLAQRRDGSACVKVLDFGISKLTSAQDAMDMTSSRAMMGSPLYMSPEQMLSAKGVDCRADVWALGVILYELLTASTPFNGETFAQLTLQIVNEKPKPMLELRPELPAELAVVVSRCLEKDAGKRFQNVGELAVALSVFGPKHARISAERVSRMMRDAGMSASALVLPPSSDAGSNGNQPDERPAGVTAAAWGRTRPGTGRSAAGWVIAALAAAGLGVGAWFVTRASPPSSAASATAPAQSAPALASTAQLDTAARLPVAATPSAPAAPTVADSSPNPTPAHPGKALRSSARVAPGRVPLAADPAVAAAPAALPAPAPTALVAPAKTASTAASPAPAPPAATGFVFGGRN